MANERLYFATNVGRLQTLEEATAEARRFCKNKDQVIMKAVKVIKAEREENDALSNIPTE